MRSITENSIDRPLSDLISVNLTFQYINKKLESEYGLSIVQWSLLKTLLKMPTVSPLILAKALKVTPGTLSQTLTRLLKKKYIFICNDSKDARKKMIALTRTGKETIDKMKQHYDMIFSDIDGVSAAINKLEVFLASKVKSRLESGV